MSDQQPLDCPATVIPYLAVQGADQALKFYQKAFGAVVTVRLPADYGRVSHAEFRIGGAPIMIADEYPDIDDLSTQATSTQTSGESQVMILLDVPDVDAMFQRAVAAGATVVRPLQDGFDGTLRTCRLEDPFGHRWLITTRKDPQKLNTILRVRSQELPVGD